jgi:hypothetical protein
VISYRKEFKPYTPHIIITFVSRSNFKKVPGIHWYDLQEFLLSIKNCIDILRRLTDAVRRKRLQKWRTNSPFLLRDNAAAHRSILVKDFLAKNNVTTLEHPLFIPDLVPADFYLFPPLK